MKFLSATPLEGWLWAVRGLQAYRHHPFHLSALMLGYLALSLFTLSLPWVGPFFFLMCMPMLGLGAALATQAAVQEGRRAGFMECFFMPWAHPAQTARPLLMLSVVYAGGSLLLMLLADGLDGGALATFQEQLAKGELDAATVNERLQSGELQWSVMGRLLLITLWSLPFWYAPWLVYRSAMPVRQALWASLWACWRNKGALSLYSASWGLWVVLVLLGLELLASWLGGSGWSLLVVAVSVVMTLAFYTSVYFTWVGSWQRGSESPPHPHPDPFLPD